MRRQVRAKRAEFKRRAIERQAGLCIWCGREMLVDPKFMHDPLFATREHLRPKSKGGGMKEENIAAAHAICNWKRGDLR